MNDRQFSRFLIILVVGFLLLHIPLAFYYMEFLSKWSYELWMAFLGVILISRVFQVPHESDYNRAVQSSFLSSLIPLGAKDFSEYRSKSKHYQEPVFCRSHCVWNIVYPSHFEIKGQTVINVQPLAAVGSIRLGALLLAQGH